MLMQLSSRYVLLVYKLMTIVLVYKLRDNCTLYVQYNTWPHSIRFGPGLPLL